MHVDDTVHEQHHVLKSLRLCLYTIRIEFCIKFSNDSISCFVSYITVVAAFDKIF